MADLKRARQERDRYSSLHDQKMYDDFLFGAMSGLLTPEQLEQALATAHRCMYRYMDTRSEIR
jgi:predicted RNA-binding protein associated with RNAse of E/G family